MTIRRRTFDRLKGKKVELWAAILAAIITAAGTIVATYLSVYLGGRQQERPEDLPAIGIASPSLAEFPSTDEYPRNSYNFEWKVFNDSKCLGNSLIWYETLARTDRKDDRFLRVHVSTGTRYHFPYCGVYTDFSYPPYRTLDLSLYNGIEFEARWLPEANTTNSAEFLIQVAVLGIPCYKYHEMGFSLSPGETRFTPIRVPFAVLATPSHAETQYAFDPKKVFRIGFVVKGKDATGSLDLDSVRLYR